MSLQKNLTQTTKSHIKMIIHRCRRPAKHRGNNVLVSHRTPRSLKEAQAHDKLHAAKHVQWAMLRSMASNPAKRAACATDSLALGKQMPIWFALHAFLVMTKHPTLSLCLLMCTGASGPLTVIAIKLFF